MRFVLMGLFILAFFGIGIGLVILACQKIKNLFKEEKLVNNDKYKEKANRVKKEKNSFEVFVENYIKNKATESENTRILQFIARDIMKSQEYMQESLKFNIITIIFLILILSGSILASFIGNIAANEHSYFINIIIGIVDFFLFCMIINRMKYKKFRVFGQIPLSSSQAEKLTKMETKGSVKDYILEKARRNHGLNGADLIFLTTMV